MHHRTVAGCILGTLVCPRCDEHGPGLFGGGGRKFQKILSIKIGHIVAFQAPEKTYKNLTKKVFQEVFNASAPHSPRVSRRCAYMHMYMYRCTMSTRMSTLDQHNWINIRADPLGPIAFDQGCSHLISISGRPINKSI